MSTRTAPSNLTHGQKRLWFLHQMDPDDASYNIPLVLRLTGELSPASLRAAFEALVARHEALRSRFPAEDGNPAASVAEPGPVDVEFRDLRGDGDRLETLIADRTNRAFDLARGPLLRVSLFRTGDTEHVLCLVLHHIVADGWSLNVLRDELAAHYTAHLRGEDAGLPAPPAHPAGQEGEADEAQARESLAYWVPAGADR
ncbi:condensation domain-containing protein [Streptomyces sp. OR43]|uniref:condensation domain-containing protein n=1 Tax=Streptomyces sp. or43 TaxID=2478957 RepID=UPI0011CD62AD|nr:condensation domain-containing protein [Streptomyces sp. or43]TXS37822.1 hypothetical protein EAO72_31675 [Streptomyces sp. or43]